ncbi:MAG: hypothetical protein ACP5HU_12335 [Phycisphaerae bacterium]
MAIGLTGCDRGWQEFERIRLGAMMPEGSLLRAANTASEQAGEEASDSGAKLWGWSDCGTWPVPVSVGMHSVTAETDAQGRVVAKSYFAHAWSNYLLFTAVAMRHVVEVHVPADLLADPAATDPDDGLIGIENCPTLRSHVINVMSSLDPRPVCDYDALKLPMVASGANYMAGMSFGGGYHDLVWSITGLPLEGLNEDGYDRTFRPVAGGSIRLQNLERGRIRIEANLFRVYDPLALAAYLYVRND